LASPANDFVASFVGAERGLKRLALLPVKDIEPEQGPVVSPATSAEEARRVIEEGGFGWASVVDEGELLGWIETEDLPGAQSVADTKPRRFSAHLTPESSLRQALDSIVTSRTQVAVVLEEGQRFLGILTLDRVSKEILS
jgi:osmoprotectant transport system ATP-binding protein